MIEVVAGLLVTADDRVLLGERLGDSPFKGMWEFPGGKIAAGETAEQALIRELREELGVGVRRSRRFMALEHRYADRHVTLEFFLVDHWSGTPAGLDGQRLRWTAIRELDAEELLPADAPVVRALQAEVLRGRGSG